MFWLRMAKNQVADRFRPPISPLAPLQETFRCWPGDTLYGVTVNSRYLDYAEVARISWLRRMGLLRLAFKEKWLPLMAAQTAQYKRPLLRFQKVDLTTRLLCWNDKWFYSEHLFERDGKTLVSVIAKGCVRGREGVVSPVEMLHRLGIRQASPTFPEAVRQWEDSMKRRLDLRHSGAGVESIGLHQRT